MQYSYTEMAGDVNNSRLVSMTYPDGYTLNYNYGSGGSLNYTISRLDSISDDSGTLESYQFQGVGTVVERDHPQSGVNESITFNNLGEVAETDWGNDSTTVDDYSTATMPTAICSTRRTR